MKVFPLLVCSVAVSAAFAGFAQAQDASADAAAYKQKMHDCVTQAKADHPDQNYKMRRKACHKQLGPMPKAAAGTPPATTAPVKPN